ncbi:MAG: type II secretion system protein M, partial [Gammaproteobacteria bacterium]|nr:type II secretion system protein M [Gammaproteobacteria bacterium]
MKDWYDSLEAREQILVLVGAIVVIVALLFSLVWVPIDKGHARVASSVNTWERSLAELRPLVPLAASGEINANSVAVSSSQQAPIIIVDQTLRSRGLEQYRRRSQPTTANGIRVEFENVAFDELILWLGDLSDQHAMHVQAGSLSAISQAGPGRINAS